MDVDSNGEENIDNKDANLDLKLHLVPWKKKYTLLQKKCENVEKQNLRLINRLYHIDKITRRTVKERAYIMKKLDSYNDDYKNKLTAYFDNEVLKDNPVQHKHNTELLNVSKHSDKIGKNSAYPKTSSQDPNLPKKPINAFLRYCQQERTTVLNQQPEMSNQELTKELAKNWNTLAADGKQEYYDSYERDKERYDRELLEMSGVKVKEEGKGGETDSESDDMEGGDVM